MRLNCTGNNSLNSCIYRKIEKICMIRETDSGDQIENRSIRKKKRKYSEKSKVCISSDEIVPS